MGLSLSKLWEMVKDREAQRAAVHGLSINTTEWLNNTEKDEIRDIYIEKYTSEKESVFLKKKKVNI